MKFKLGKKFYSGKKFNFRKIVYFFLKKIRDNKNYYLLNIPFILSKIPVVVRTPTPMV